MLLTSNLSVGKIPEPNDVLLLGKIYEGTERRLQEEFRGLTPIEYSDLKGMEFKRKVEALIRDLNRQALKWSRKAGVDAYLDAKNKATLLLEILGAKEDPTFDERIHTNTMRDGIIETNEVLLKADISINMTAEFYVYLTRQASLKISSSFDIQAWDMRDEEMISDLLDEALIAGASAWRAGKLVMAHLEELIGEGKFITINGRNYNAKKYAKMVARTRLRTIQSRAVLISCYQYDNDLIQVSDHGTDTPICLPFEGNVYSISGRHSDYPTLPDTPPFHPNCLDGNSRTLTNKGLIQIKDIKKGDMVFTHKGRFKPVTHTMKRKFNGQLIWINGLGITYNHRIFTKSGLIPAGNLNRNDKIMELSFKQMNLSGVCFDSDYFPAQRRKIRIPFSILFRLAIMVPSVNFKINFVNSKIKKIRSNGFFLNIINSSIIKNSCGIFSKIRLIFQCPMAITFCNFVSNFRISRRIIANHSNLIFPIGFRIGIGNSPDFKASGISSFNSKMIKNFLNSMSIIMANSNHIGNIKHKSPRVISLFYNFFKWSFKSRLNPFNFVQELLPFSASERTSLGIPTFSRLSANNTNIHNDFFVANDIKDYAPKMLPYNGDVFNIEVEEDHSYVAEGFLVKNCMHNMSPTSAAQIERNPQRRVSKQPKEI